MGARYGAGQGDMEEAGHVAVDEGSERAQMVMYSAHLHNPRKHLHTKQICLEYIFARKTIMIS